MRSSHLHDSGVEEVEQLLDGIAPHLRHEDDGLTLGVALQHRAKEGRHRGEDEAVADQLAVLALDHRVREQLALLAQLGDGDYVAVVAVECHHPVSGPSHLTVTPG